MKNKRTYLSGGVNADDDFELIPEGDLVNSENFRISSTDNGATSRREIVGGTDLITDQILNSTGSHICVGGCTDEVNNWIVWFAFHGVAAKSGIYCWDKASGNTYKVLLNTQVTGGLNLKKTRENYIHSCFIHEGILYWTDNFGEPCRVNVKAGINLNHPGTFTDTYSLVAPMDNSVITIIRKPPYRSPGVLKVLASPSITYNLCDGKVFRFAWRWNYRDGEVSVLSPLTEIVDFRENAAYSYNSVKVAIAVDSASGSGYDTLQPDARGMELIVQFAETGKYMIIKSWDRDVAADAADIATFVGGGALEYYFKNDQAGEMLDDVYAVKPFDNVPWRCRTLAMAKNRLFSGYNYVGRSAPTATSLTLVSVISAGVSNAQTYFKSDSAFETAIEFYDKFGRKCGIVKGPAVTTPDMAYYAQPTVPSRVQTIQLSLSNINAVNEIPDWAYYYRICLSHGQQASFFMQGWMEAGGLKYVIKDSTTGLYTFTDTITGQPYGIGINIKQAVLAGLGYSFTEGSGDILKLYTNTSITYKRSVIDTDGDYVIVPWDNSFTGNLSAIKAVFEIYAPKRKLNSAIFYPQTLNGYGFLYVINPGQAGRTYSNTTISLTAGDIYALARRLTAPSGPVMFFEAMAPNDKYWRDWYRNDVTPNIIDKIGQKELKNTISFSNVYIPGTKTNGLSSFEPLNEVVLDSENGPISKLELVSKVQEDGTVLLALCEREAVSCYLGEQELFDTQGSAFLSRANSVIGNTKALQGSMGTRNPESVVSLNGLVYWWDSRNGTPVQYSNNGLFPVSKRKFHRPCGLFSRKYDSLSEAQIEALGGRPIIIGGFDPHHKEVLFSIPPTESSPPKGNLPDYTNTKYWYDVYDGTGKTLAYKHEIDNWGGAFTFTAEKFLRLGDDMYSFKHAYLYKHNSVAVKANFYGVQYPARLMLSNNIGAVATYYSIGVESNIKPDYIHFRTEEPYTQSSDLVIGNLARKEGVFYANIMRDRLSPNISGTAVEKQLAGDPMYGRSLLIMIEFTTPSQQTYVKFVNVGYQINKGHLQLKS